MGTALRIYVVSLACAAGRRACKGALADGARSRPVPQGREVSPWSVVRLAR
jgi:hypothetical protein